MVRGDKHADPPLKAKPQSGTWLFISLFNDYTNRTNASHDRVEEPYNPAEEKCPDLLMLQKNMLTYK